MMRDAAQALELSYQLGDLDPRAEAFRLGAFAILGRLLPCESQGRFAFDLRTVTAELWSDPAEHCVSSYRDTFVANASAHPTLLDIQDRPTDHGPRRLSDLTDPRRFRNTAMYQEVYVPMGVRHNVSFLLHPAGLSPVTAGWSFSRFQDFTDDEVELAAWIQPVLVALEVRPYSAQRPTPPQLEERRIRAGLTSREMDLLDLLADGLTAQAMARLRRISTRTVHKHLQNVYSKLGVSDRLMAVRKAQALGIVASSPFEIPRE